MLLPPDVIEICEVSDDRREWPLWQVKELRDLASVSISLEKRKIDENYWDSLIDLEVGKAAAFVRFQAWESIWEGRFHYINSSSVEHKQGWGYSHS